MTTFDRRSLLKATGVAGLALAGVAAPVGAQAAGTGRLLPYDVAAIWHHGWAGPQPFTGYPTAAREGSTRHNFIILGLAQSAQAGTGKLGYYNRFGAGLVASIDTAAAAGVKTVMGIGGSGTAIYITNTTQATEAFDSIVGFVNRYHVVGIDIDLEPSGSRWTQDGIVALVGMLRAKYPRFIIGLTPGLYGEHTAKWMSLARALGSRMTYMAPMLYDFPQAGSAEGLTWAALQKCDWMAAAGIPAYKMILGFALRPKDEPHYVNTTPDASMLTAAYRRVKEKYPTIRGYFLWEDKIAASRGWDHLPLNRTVKA